MGARRPAKVVSGVGASEGGKKRRGGELSSALRSLLIKSEKHALAQI